MKFNKKIWLSPIIFFEIYLSISVFLFIFGPWPWPVNNKVDLVLYLLFSQAIILFGYLKGWKKTKKLFNSSNINLRSEEIKKGIKFLKISILVTAILFIPTSLSRTGQILPNLIEGIKNPGIVYNTNLERLDWGNEFVYVEYIRLVLSVFLISLWPLTIVYWVYLSKLLKITCVVLIAGNLSIYIATGTNKGLADFIITLPWLVCLANASSSEGLRISRKKFLYLGIILCTIFLIFFTYGQLQRSGGVAEKGVMNLGSNLIYAESEELKPFLNENIIRGYESLTRYLGCGYYALSLAMTVDTPSTLGLGSSTFIARNAGVFFNTNFFVDQSLPGRIEDEYSFSSTQLWHSMYTWIASDLGFLGASILIAVFSYFFGLSWGRSLIMADPLAITLQYMLFIMFYYIPANNQVFQTGETCIGFIVLLMMMLINKIKNFLS